MQAPVAVQVLPSTNCYTVLPLTFYLTFIYYSHLSSLQWVSFCFFIADVSLLCYLLLYLQPSYLLFSEGKHPYSICFVLLPP